MKVMEIGADWGLEHIRPSSRPDPQPGAGQVVIKLSAATLNYRDRLMVDRGYGRRSGSLPLIPLSDAVGRVTELGPGVERLVVGQRVCPIMNQNWLHGPFRDAHWSGFLGGPLDGVMREYMALDQNHVVAVPDHLSDQQAAALPCAGLTGWSAIVDAGRVKAGESVIIQGSGGVSIFALQYAKAQGARIIATSSSDAKLARMEALGADHLINYRATPEWGKAAANLAGGEGVDLVVEVGGADTLAQSLRAVRPDGRIALIGNLSGSVTELNLAHVFMKRLRLIGVVIGNRDAFEDMVRAVDLARLEPVIDPNVYGFDELRGALEAVTERRHFGKIAIDFS